MIKKILNFNPFDSFHSLRIDAEQRRSIKFSISKRFGFTLLELLIVVGIMAILLGLGAVSYSTTQKKSRDLRRKTDLKAIHDSYEQYYSLCGFKYPLSGNNFAPSSIICASPSTAIMPTVPIDPLTTPYICNSSDCTVSSYKLCTNSLESETPATYCLQNQQ